jgi:hypothetical protein
MKKIIFVLSLLLISCVACDLEYGTAEDDIVIGEITDYDFENDIPEFENIDETIQYVITNIIHIPDKQEYWQLPEETYNLKTGDCEDQAILLMYLLNKLQIESEFIATKISNKAKHSYIYLINDNIYINPQTGTILDFEQFFKNYLIIESYAYSEIIWMTIKYHRGIKR